MAITTSIYRFQSNPGGQTDPVVEVILKETTVVEEEVFEKISPTPIYIKLSEMITMLAATSEGALKAKLLEAKDAASHQVV